MSTKEYMYTKEICRTKHEDNNGQRSSNIGYTNHIKAMHSKHTIKAYPFKGSNC